MKDASRDATRPHRRIPAVVVITASDGLVEACRQAVHAITFAVVEACGLDEVSTCVAKWRPFAMVLDQDLFAFDPKEFAALAQDVGAELICIQDTGSSREQLISRLVPALRRAFSRSEAPKR